MGLRVSNTCIKAYNLGKTVRVATHANRCHEGKFVNIDIDMDGAMVLQSQGDIFTIGYGKML